MGGDIFLLLSILSLSLSYTFPTVLFLFFYIAVFLEIRTQMAIKLLSIATKLSQNKPTYIYIHTHIVWKITEHEKDS